MYLGSIWYAFGVSSAAPYLRYRGVRIAEVSLSRLARRQAVLEIWEQIYGDSVKVSTSEFFSGQIRIQTLQFQKWYTAAAVILCPKKKQHHQDKNRTESEDAVFN